ncbi:unnamed protein product [Caenorhabditis brenneri]
MTATPRPAMKHWSTELNRLYKSRKNDKYSIKLTVNNTMGDTDVDVVKIINDIGDISKTSFFDSNVMANELDKHCYKKWDKCKGFPQLFYKKCEEYQYRDCYEKMEKAVQIHCARDQKSPACGWLTTTTQEIITTTTTTTTVAPTTQKSNTTMIVVGCLIGGLVLLAVLGALICLCRKKTSPPGVDAAGTAATTTKSTKKQKKKKGKKNRKTKGTSSRTRSGTTTKGTTNTNGSEFSV